MKCTVPVSLVFMGWRGIEGTERGTELSMGQLHYGSTFDGTITLEVADASTLEEALAEISPMISPMFALQEMNE